MVISDVIREKTVRPVPGSPRGLERDPAEPRSHAEPLARTPAAESDVILDLRGLVTRFGPKTVHDGLDLAVRRGEILVLMGGSGAGKSTLLRSLIGLETPAAGQCLFAGEDVFAKTEAELVPVRRAIAYAFQGGALFDGLTVGENLAYPLLAHTTLDEEARRAAIAAMLAKVRLPGIEAMMPAALSGGMQKRVGLARALMLDPQVILYDEPTAGLDPANTRAIADVMRDLRAEGRTGILVTHDVPCARLVGDRFAFIHGGRIAALQTREEFAAAPHPLLAAYVTGEDVT